jgi:small subunit ribosomal protein S21
LPVSSAHAEKAGSHLVRGAHYVQVTVLKNDIEQALKQLKRKLQTDGVLKELKNKRFYEKPSVKKKRKQLEAERRRRKAARKFRKPERD